MRPRQCPTCRQTSTLPGHGSNPSTRYSIWRNNDDANVPLTTHRLSRDIVFIRPQIANKLSSPSADAHEFGSDSAVTSNDGKRLPSVRSRLATRFYRVVGALPIRVPESWSPTFLVGCGRSGTTITGQVLNRHREIAFVNEPRYIWRAINPETDIWYVGTNQTGGKLSLDANDAENDQSTAARRMFRLRQGLSRRQRLLEKLPINSFRIAYLRALFPTCRLIHIVRNGLEVAHSIARTGPAWYGANNGHKWCLLREYGAAHGIQPSFLNGCHSDLEKGLVEWTLSVRAATTALARIPDQEFVQIRYDELVSASSSALGRIEEFLGVTRDEAMHQYGRRVLKRRNNSASNLSQPDHVCIATRELLESI